MCSWPRAAPSATTCDSRTRCSVPLHRRILQRARPDPFRLAARLRRGRSSPTRVRPRDEALKDLAGRPAVYQARSFMPDLALTEAEIDDLIVWLDSPGMTATAERPTTTIFRRPSSTKRALVVDHHRRPQADRHHVRRRRLRLLHRRRHRGAADPHPARPGRTAVPDRRTSTTSCSRCTARR